jgi:hypothetical protein
MAYGNVLIMSRAHWSTCVSPFRGCALIATGFDQGKCFLWFLSEAEFHRKHIC